MVEKKLHKCDEADPNRCQGQANSQGGQCHFLSMAGMVREGLLDDEKGIYTHTTNCPKHGGSQQAKSVEKKRFHDLQLTIWQQRVDELAESDHIKTLRGEIGVLRLLLESLMAQCTDNLQLMMYSNKISDLIIKIEKLVASCNRLETATGKMLDRSSALLFAGQIVEIISKHIQDENVVEAISNGIIDALAEATDNG